MWREILIWVGAFSFIALVHWIFRPITRRARGWQIKSRFWRIVLTVAVMLFAVWWAWYRWNYYG